MQWVSTLSLNPLLDTAVEEAVASVTVQLDGRDPDLAVVFLSADYAPDFERLPEILRARLRAGGVGGRRIAVPSARCGRRLRPRVWTLRRSRRAG